ncbi:hypothetical protein PYCC9005_005856 [Savitreella phatthalungensis]
MASAAVSASGAVPHTTNSSPLRVLNAIPALRTNLKAKRQGAGLFLGGFTKSVAAATKTVAIQVTPPAAADPSRPPSLITDNGSLTGSSRSPSPEPASKLELAFRSYVANESARTLHTILPLLGNSLDAQDVNVVLKWWNHLLLVSRPCAATTTTVIAFAGHPSSIASSLWDAHFELTLSTLLCQPSTVIPTAPFARLLAVGYLHHAPTRNILRGLFRDPTHTRDNQPWIKRAKSIEVFVELTKSVYEREPAHSDEGGVMASRLEQMIGRVIDVTTAPTYRLANLHRLVVDTQGPFASLLEDCLVRVAKKTPVFKPVACFYLMDFMRDLQLQQLDFWHEVLRRILATDNHVLQIRAFALLYDSWDTNPLGAHCIDLLLSRDQWEFFFAHWSGIVRDHYMRLLAFKVARTHPRRLRQMLRVAFETGLQENCQLRDCLPGSPIPNKRFVIRQMAAPPQPRGGSQPLVRSPAAVVASPSPRAGEAPSSMFATYDEEESGSTVEYAAELLRKKTIGLLRGFWAEGTPTSPTTPPLPQSPPMLAASTGPATMPTPTPSTIMATTSPTRPPLVRDPVLSAPRYKFVQEFVGKRWSLTNDADAVAFLDGVMGLARHGRLPAYCPGVSASSFSSSSPSRDIHASDEAILPIPLGPARKQLWTRSLSEWSVLLDDLDAFHRATTPRAHSVIAPALEVDFPRWFIHRPAPALASAPAPTFPNTTTSPSITGHLTIEGLRIE